VSGSEGDVSLGMPVMCENNMRKDRQFLQSINHGEYQVAVLYLKTATFTEIVLNVDNDEDFRH